MTDTLLPRFDPTTIAGLVDPYPTYAQLRAMGPLLRGGPAQYVVTRHREMAQLVRHPHLGRAFPDAYHRAAFGNGEMFDFFRRIVLARDGEAHDRLRRVMGEALSSGVVRSMARRTEAFVDELMTTALEAGVVDAVAAVAFPLPMQMTCELLAIPVVDRAEVAPRAVDLVRGFAAPVPEEQRPATDAAVRWFRGYIGGLLDERRTRPGDDFLSLMLSPGPDGRPLPPEDIVDNAVFLFFAGFETAVGMIASQFAVLASRPEAFERLRREPHLADTAAGELLRYDPPVQVISRYVRQPIQLCGRTIKAGRVLDLLLGSANRDEREFADPDDLDLGRRPNRHLSFGGGVHHCLGGALAQVEGVAVLSQLASRCAAVVPAGAPTRQLGASFRGYEHVPVELVPA